MQRLRRGDPRRTGADDRGREEAGAWGRRACGCGGGCANVTRASLYATPSPPARLLTARARPPAGCAPSPRRSRRRGPGRGGCAQPRSRARSACGRPRPAGRRAWRRAGTPSRRRSRRAPARSGRRRAARARSSPSPRPPRRPPAPRRRTASRRPRCGPWETSSARPGSCARAGTPARPPRDGARGRRPRRTVGAPLGAAPASAAAPQRLSSPEALPDRSGRRRASGG